MVWVFLALGLVSPFLIRAVAPRGWAKPRPMNVMMLAASASAWIAVGAYAGRADGGLSEHGPFLVVLFVGMVIVEGCLLLRPSRWRSGEGDIGEVDEGNGTNGEEPLSPEAEQLLQRALGLEDTSVEELMTHRDHVLTVQGGLTAGEVLEEMRRSSRTRIVIVEGTLDRILGIAHAKDLVPLVLEGRGSEPVRRHLRRLLRVPRKLSARRLLEEFRRNRVTLGAVADVRGRTLGIVSLTDVFHFIADVSASQSGAGVVGNGDGAAGGAPVRGSAVSRGVQDEEAEGGRG
ncbi:MAG: CBS domain-containing protein [Candidatus Eisenbacteria bacterium]